MATGSSLTPSQKRVAIRRFAHQQWDEDPLLDKQAILSLAEGSIPTALTGRTRDSNLKLIKSELVRAFEGKPFMVKLPKRRPAKATPALKRRVAELFDENPYGASYRTIAEAITAEGTKVGKDVVGSIVKELSLKEHPP